MFEQRVPVHDVLTRGHDFSEARRVHIDLHHFGVAVLCWCRLAVRHRQDQTRGESARRQLSVAKRAASIPFCVIDVVFGVVKDVEDQVQRALELNRFMLHGGCRLQLRVQRSV